MKKLIVYKPAVKKLLQSQVKRSAFGGCGKFFHKRKPIPDLLSAIAFGAKILSISVFRNANFGNVGKGIALNGWRYVFGLPCMVYRDTTTANGKLKYTACYLLGGLISRYLI